MRELFSPTISLPGVDMEICEVDRDTGTASLRFEVSDARANQFGSIQDGVVATLLDACIGIAGAARSGGVLAMPLAEMNVSFIRAAPPGTIMGYRRRFRRMSLADIDPLTMR
jgi:acyl-coenzyme A thioesterase PaaI-like protein